MERRMVDVPNYCTNTEFCNKILEYKRTKNKKIYEWIGKTFIKIAEGHIRRPCFGGYSQDRKNEMISDAVFLMTKKLGKYDPTYIPNPFSFFTTIAFRSFLQRITHNKKRDKVTKSLNYIDKIENAIYARSTTFKNSEPLSE